MSADSTKNVLSRRSRPVRIALALVATAIVILSLFGIAVSRVPMRGAELFGFIAKKIKGNPGATTVICLAAVAGLWLAIGLMAAVQQWLAGRRGVPKQS
jgi:hypothetical protein